jgi:CDP-glycerol glycerophosphotransferase (TagB/SpsB family)
MVQWGPIALNSAWLARVATDVAAVEGEAAAEVVRACDNGEDLRVVVTGQPKYDLLREQAAAASRAETCKHYGFDPGRPIVLYASPFVSEESAPMRRSAVEEQKLANEIETVCNTIRCLPGVQLAVKPHPNEGTRLHHEVVNRLQSSDLHLMPKHAPIYPVLFACDAVVTHHSTVGMEGVLLEKPLVIVNLTGRPDAVPYVEGGVAIGAYEAKDVPEALRKALYDPETRRRMVKSQPSFMRRYGFLGEGSATGRMLDLVLTMADSHSTN